MSRIAEMACRRSRPPRWCTVLARPLHCSSAALLLVLCLALLARPAGAVTANRKKAESLFIQGVAAFKAKDLPGAARLFEEALKLDRHPLLLYNLAVVYDQLDDQPNAIRTYKAYLKSKPPDDAFIRARLKQLDPEALVALDREIEAAKAVAAAQQGKTEVKKPPDKPPRQVGPSTGPKVSGLTWAVLGLGLAGMAGGTAFGLMTAGAVDDFNAAKLRSEAENAKVRAESRSLYANIGFLVGGLALTGGAALLTVNLLSGGGGQAAATAGGSGGELSSSSAGWSLRPKLGPDGAGLVLHQEF